MNLDIGLPVDVLRKPVKACLDGESPHHEMVVQATNRRGRQIACRVTTSPLLGMDRRNRGVILLMEETEETPQA